MMVTEAHAIFLLAQSVDILLVKVQGESPAKL